MISIVIPLYNVENYIKRCLQSFENQTYRDFELIIVNDGSTDNSQIIVEEYIKKTKMTVKLINQTNSGVSSARNKGILIANGDYICFVDSDDMVVHDYLEKLIKNLEKTKSDLIICGMKSVIDSHSENIVAFKPNNITILETDEALTEFLYKRFVCGMGSFLIRKKVLLDNNLRFSETYSYSEDQELIWKMINHSKKMVLISNELYMYRIRPNSAMSIVDRKRIDGLHLMLNLEKYFKEYNPSFAKKFNKYGVARWVWSTLWQHALVSNNYKSFIVAITEYNTNENMKSLLTYPNIKVKLSSSLYIINSRLYYILVKIIGYKNKNIRKMSS